MKMASLSSVVLCSLSVAYIVSGCASTDVTRLGERSMPSRNCSIKVLAENPRDQKYEEVCLLTSARGGQSVFEEKTVEALLPDMKKEACVCGADAIVLKNSKAGGYNFAGPADR